MKTEEEINEKILKLTTLIQEDYPELAVFLDEMPSTTPNDNDPNIKLKNLTLYYDSLLNIVRSYVTEHQLTYINQRTGTGHL